MSTPQALVEALVAQCIQDRSPDSKPCGPTTLFWHRAPEFFAELLSKMESSDATIVDFDCGSVFEGDMVPDDYGYESDSDLEDEVEEQACQTSASDETVVPDGDVRKSDDDGDDDLPVVADTRSTVGDPVPTNPLHGAMLTSDQHNPRVVDCRNMLVRDTAFRTWKALMLYLYTDNITFSPLKSQGLPGVNVAAQNPITLWPCSPKSMYRLACKVRLDRLRDKALSAIRSSLNEENILQELSSSFTSKYPAILQMQVEILLKHITSVPVIQNIPALVKRIAGSQLPHGADIIIDLFQKVLLRYHPHAPTEREQPPPVVSRRLRPLC